MATELEAKYRVGDFAAVRRALRAAGAAYLGTAEETDTFFDTPRRHLYRSGRGLRLRRVRVLRSVAGGRKGGWLLTVKGPSRPNSRMKVRREEQTPIADGLAMRRMLAEAGLPAFVTLTKRRATYRLGRCLVELDELPGLGRFVEIEGPSQRAVEAARRGLGLDDKPIAKSYLALIEAKGRAAGR